MFGQRFLVVYSGILTAAFAVTVLSDMDAVGHDRIKLSVPATGTPEIAFLDEYGKVVKTVSGGGDPVKHR
jgi:hypothetical protein